MSPGLESVILGLFVSFQVYLTLAGRTIRNLGVLLRKVRPILRECCEITT